MYIFVYFLMSGFLTVDGMTVLTQEYQEILEFILLISLRTWFLSVAVHPA
jgi:hypothetical protein